MDLKELKVGDLMQLVNLVGSKGSADHPYEIGKNYFIRTVTFIYTGKLVSVTDQELVLDQVAWVADTGRYADALKDFGVLSEVEPYPDGTKVIIGRGAIVDASITLHELPRNQKPA